MTKIPTTNILTACVMVQCCLTVYQCSWSTAQPIKLKSAELTVVHYRHLKDIHFCNAYVVPFKNIGLFHYFSCLSKAKFRVLLQLEKKSSIYICRLLSLTHSNSNQFYRHAQLYCHNPLWEQGNEEAKSFLNKLRLLLNKLRDRRRHTKPHEDDQTRHRGKETQGLRRLE